MTIPRLFRTSSFRLTVLYAGLFIISTGLLFGIVYWIAKDVLREQTRASLQSEMASLETRAASSSFGDLVAEIEKRLANSGGRSLYYSLQDSSGRKLAGNLPEFDAAPGWHEIAFDKENGGNEHAARQDTQEDHELVVAALVRELPNGNVVTVASDTFQTIEAEEAIARSFAWAAAAALILALMGGMALSHGFLQRVDEINRTTQAIISGNLKERIRTAGTGDELDQLGANLNAMLDRLEALMEGLKQVSNDIAHDMRTPLSRLKQRLEIVRLEGETRRDYEQAVDDALQDANAALSTFSALLRIAQIESGSRRANFSDLNLSSLVEEMVATYAPVAEDLGKKISAEVEPSCHVQGDRELLIQMFANLFENSLRHTPDKARIGVSLYDGAAGAAVDIFDNGSGIPETEYDKVLRRFYRVESSRSTPGSGLGLALVAAVAALHGIRIRLSDNRPGLRVKLQFKDEPLS